MGSRLSACVFGRTFQFASIKEVMNKANDLRSGDVQAGLCADSDRARVAAWPESRWPRSASGSWIRAPAATICSRSRRG
jgi:hypothetical protein